jgi:hypothetical protein
MLIIPHFSITPAFTESLKESSIPREINQHASLQLSPLRGQVQGPCDPHDKYMPLQRARI